MSENIDTVDSIESKKDRKPRSPNKVDLLEKRIDQLEHTICMMAHFNGTNRVLDECGLDRWTPSKKHMRKTG